MTYPGMDRRSLMALAALAPILALPGCATTGGWSLTDAIERLLTLSSQRAFALLLQPGGFYDSAVARIDVPEESRGSALLRRIAGGPVVRERLERLLNDAAEQGAERAAPIVADAIGSIRVTDALAIVRGGPHAATDLLEGQLGGGLIEAMLPELGEALRLADDPLVAELLRASTGVDVSGLVRSVADQANRGIWRAIAAEEAAIRADPRSTRDPVLIGVFGLGRAAGY